MNKICEGKNCPNGVVPHFRDTNFETETLINVGDSRTQYGGVSPNDISADSVCPNSPYRSRWHKVRSVLSSLTIEPVMFAFMFGYVMNATVLSNMIMDKGCLFFYKYPPEVCRHLNDHQSEKHNVELLATKYSIYGNLLSFIAAFLMIFIAPWSDKYGRKLPLLMAVFGTFLTDVGYVYCTIYFDSDLIYILLSKLPTELFGGFICIFTVIFSLASEMSSPRNRSLKYTTVEVAFGLGAALGGLAGGLVYRY